MNMGLQYFSTIGVANWGRICSTTVALETSLASGNRARRIGAPR